MNKNSGLGFLKVRYVKLNRKPYNSLLFAVSITGGKAGQDDISHSHLFCFSFRYSLIIIFFDDFFQQISVRWLCYLSQSCIYQWISIQNLINVIFLYVLSVSRCYSYPRVQFHRIPRLKRIDRPFIQRRSCTDHTFHSTLYIWEA